MLNHTHDPALRSWVDSAQAVGCDFPIQNLPHGVFRRRGTVEAFRGGVAIGDRILDLAQAAAIGAFADDIRAAAQAAAAASLNEFMAMGASAWRPLRAELSRVLREGAAERTGLAACLVPQVDAEHAVPARIGDYTDFFTSYDHMINAGRVFQPDAPPLPNFKWLPIGYHGRASTVVVSGTPCHRPQGQTRAPGAASPSFGPSQRLDYEMELGLFVGPGNKDGRAIALPEADDQVFGMVLLNDWSARDMQGWESMPLGPFLSKNFLTSISPWIVTTEALAPYRCALPRTADDPPSLPYLDVGAGARPSFDIQLEVQLHTAAGGDRAMTLSRSSYRHAYWAPSQLIAHHSSNGCRLRPGDLMGTGTQSGPGVGEQGCLLELTRGGRDPLRLHSNEQRAYLEDGDTVVLRAWCERDGAARIGFGECRGTLLPATFMSRTTVQWTF
jgi:fumarylacetoacetase